MSHLNLTALQFRMVDHVELRRSLGRCVQTVSSCSPNAYILDAADACRAVNTRSTFAELAVELGLREESKS